MGYYYEIAFTGVPEVDAVGFAVERAGKAYHHTRDWNEKDGNGRCVVDDIDDALKACAARIAALEAEVARVGRVVACAQSFDHAATVSRLNPDDVAMHFTELHIALQELRALTPTQEPTNE
jgi:hypothetical protein